MQTEKVLLSPEDEEFVQITPTNVTPRLRTLISETNHIPKILSLSQKLLTEGTYRNYGFEGDDSIADMTASNLDSGIISPEKSVERSLFQRDLKEMLTILDEDELKVIELRYGLKDGLTRTVTSVAAEMKQTPDTPFLLALVLY